MAKLIGLMKSEDAIAEATSELSRAGLADYQIINLSDDYEHEIRQEVFLFRYEAYLIIVGALIGAILGGAAAHSYSMGVINFSVLAPFLAGGSPAAVFVGAGVGSALGVVLGALWGFSEPLDRDYSQEIMLVLYCRSDQKARAIQIVNSHGGVFI